MSAVGQRDLGGCFLPGRVRGPSGRISLAFARMLLHLLTAACGTSRPLATIDRYVRYWENSRPNIRKREEGENKGVELLCSNFCADLCCSGTRPSVENIKAMDGTDRVALRVYVRIMARPGNCGLALNLGLHTIRLVGLRRLRS